jgi:hypothetical protein
MDMSSYFHAPATLTLGKELQYPLDRRLGGPQSWSRSRVEGKNPALPRIKTQTQQIYFGNSKNDGAQHIMIHNRCYTVLSFRSPIPKVCIT